MTSNSINGTTRIVTIVLLAIAIGFMSLSWMSLYSTTRAATRSQEVTIVEGLQLDTPEFREGFSSSLSILTDLRRLPNLTGGIRFSILLMVASGVCFLWYKTDFQAEDLAGRILFGTSSLLPLIVGLGMTPGLIRESFAAMAEVGLSQPMFIGAGAGEAFAPFVVGGVLGLLLLIGFVFLLRRRTEA